MKLHNTWWCDVHGSQWVQGHVDTAHLFAKCPKCRRPMRRLREVKLGPIPKENKRR